MPKRPPWLQLLLRLARPRQRPACNASDDSDLTPSLAVAVWSYHVISSQKPRPEMAGARLGLLFWDARGSRLGNFSTSPTQTGDTAQLLHLLPPLMTALYWLTVPDRSMSPKMLDELSKHMSPEWTRRAAQGVCRQDEARRQARAKALDRFEGRPSRKARTCALGAALVGVLDKLTFN